MKAWGCDPALRHVSLACVENGKLLAVESFAFPRRGTLPDDLDHLAISTTGIAFDLWKAHGVPSVIAVEQPSGRFNNLRSAYAVGVVLATLHRHGAVVDLPSKTWRKAAFGSAGQRTKEAKVAAMELARELGYEGNSEDESEAICIAVAAERLTTIEK